MSTRHQLCTCLTGAEKKKGEEWHLAILTLKLASCWQQLSIIDQEREISGDQIRAKNPTSSHSEISLLLSTLEIQVLFFLRKATLLYNDNLVDYWFTLPSVKKKIAVNNGLHHYQDTTKTYWDWKCFSILWRLPIKKTVMHKSTYLQ